jgi:class 3 adenylate cyclase
VTGPLRAAAQCDACAAPLQPGADRCAACGSPVGPSARRVVTVLFADLAGYTRYCSERDPEDVHLLVRPLMNALRGLCEELGGRVPVIEGDGFMAVFGAEETRADDPRLAVLAACRMQELVHARSAAAADAIPALSVGMHVGEVLVAPSWEQGGVSVSGDVVNLASRLCKVAAESEVLVTAALVACVPLDVWVDVRHVDLRGLDTSEQVASLAWDRVAAPAVVLRGESRTPFVDRPELRDVAAAIAEHRALVVVGEPGIGKSRLLSEAVGAHPGLVLRARFSELEPGHAALAGLARDLLRTLSTDAVGPLEHRRLRRLAGEQVDTTEHDSYADQLASLVSGIAAADDVVVLLDDADALSGEELALAAELVAAGHAVLLAARHPLALRADELRLNPLDRDAVHVFVERLLPGAPAELAQHLADRSGGVPLFVEQYVRLLVEDGTIELGPDGATLTRPERLGALPTAMRLFVASRLDVLEPATRRVIGLAAVAGMVVDVDLLSYLSGRDTEVGEHVEVLVERGYLEWARPEPGVRAQVRFRHQVIRDVAYEALLKRDRVATHRAAAEWYAVLPVVALLAEEARHLEAALGLGEPDCELVRRLVEVLGLHAASVVEENPPMALDAVLRAEQVATAHPQCQVDLLPVLSTKARALLAGGDDETAGELADRVAAEAQSRGVPAIEATARLTAATARVLSEPEASAEELTRAEQLFRAAADETGVARVETARAEGDVPLAARLAAWDRAYEAAMRAGESRLASVAAQDLAMHASVRSPAEAETWLRTATELRRADDVVGAARLAVAESLLALIRLDFETAAVRGSAAAAEAQAAGQHQLFMNAALFTLEAEVLGGGLVQAQQLVDELLAVAGSRPTEHLRVDVLTCSALLLSRQGRGRDAAALLAELEPQVAALGPHYPAQWHGFSARVALERGDFAAATVHADEAARMQVELDVPAWALRERLVSLISRLAVGAHVGLAELSQARSEARVVGAGSVAGLLGRWGELADTLAGAGSHALDLPEGPESAETAALDLEIMALRDGRPDLLLAAAAQWQHLGTTVWEARALLWHSELTGTPSPEADAVLTALGSPDGLAETLRAQVRTS